MYSVDETHVKSNVNLCSKHALQCGDCIIIFSVQKMNTIENTWWTNIFEINIYTFKLQRCHFSSIIYHNVFSNSLEASENYLSSYYSLRVKQMHLTALLSHYLTELNPSALFVLDAQFLYLYKGAALQLIGMMYSCSMFLSLCPAMFKCRCMSSFVT